MRINKYYVVIIIIVMVVGITLSLQFGSQDKKTQDKNADRASEDPEAGKYFKDVDFVLFNGPKTVKWLLKAEDMEQPQQQEKILLQPVLVDAFNAESGENADEVVGGVTFPSNSEQAEGSTADPDPNNETSQKKEKSKKNNSDSKSQEEKSEGSIISLKKMIESTGDSPLYDFSGNKGWYYTREKKLEVEGPVTINRKDYTLTSDSLTWYQQENMIEGGGGVRVQGPDFILTGEDFEADTALSYFKIIGGKDRANLIWEKRGNQDEDKNNG